MCIYRQLNKILALVERIVFEVQLTPCVLVTRVISTRVRACQHGDDMDTLYDGCICVKTYMIAMGWMLPFPRYSVCVCMRVCVRVCVYACVCVDGLFV